MYKDWAISSEKDASVSYMERGLPRALRNREEVTSNAGACRKEVTFFTTDRTVSNPS